MHQHSGFDDHHCQAGGQSHCSRIATFHVEHEMAIGMDFQCSFFTFRRAVVTVCPRSYLAFLCKTGFPEIRWRFNRKPIKLQLLSNWASIDQRLRLNWNTFFDQYSTFWSSANCKSIKTVFHHCMDMQKYRMDIHLVKTFSTLSPAFRLQVVPSTLFSLFAWRYDAFIVNLHFIEE